MESGANKEKKEFPSAKITKVMEGLNNMALTDSEKRLVLVVDGLLREYSDDTVRVLGEKMDRIEDRLRPEFEELLMGDITRIHERLSEIVLREYSDPNDIYNELLELLHEFGSIGEPIKRDADLNLDKDLVALHDKIMDALTSLKDEHSEMLKVINKMSRERTQAVIDNIVILDKNNELRYNNTLNQMGSALRELRDSLKVEISRVGAEVRSIQTKRRLS